MKISDISFLYEIGLKKNQEDFIFPIAGSANTSDKIFIVCDGVGGSESGEFASKIVAEHVGQALQKSDLEKITIQKVNSLLSEAKNKLIAFAKLNNVTNMATTLTLLVLKEKHAFIAWCGDSRIYHIRNGKVLYKTSDHSLVNSLIKSGEISEDEARKHPQRNVILKAIQNDSINPDAEGFEIIEIKTGDYFLLCTDGVLENIGDRELNIILNENKSGDLISHFQSYCKGKTRDNYSMYLLSVVNTKNKKLNTRWIATSLLLILFIVLGSLFIMNNYNNIPQNKPTPIQKIETNKTEIISTPTPLIIPKKRNDSIKVKKQNIIKPTIREKLSDVPIVSPDEFQQVKEVNLDSIQKNKLIEPKKIDNIGTIPTESKKDTTKK
jgi:serine/threonine protein phosphatase PrpC